jgi:hypothetical protein
MATRAEHRAYEQKYRDSHRVELHARAHLRKTKFSEGVRLLRTVQGCDKCGKTTGKLVHHHIDPATKRVDVARMAGHSLESLTDEIAKCSVLCASCHKRTHDARLEE